MSDSLRLEAEILRLEEALIIAERECRRRGEEIRRLLCELRSLQNIMRSQPTSTEIHESVIKEALRRSLRECPIEDD